MTTQRFGFENDGLTSGKFATVDRDLLDRLLAFFETHDHTGGATPEPLADPVGTPVAAVSSSGGTLTNGQSLYYVVTFLDAYGLETAASPQVQVDLDASPASHVAPIPTGGTGGTLASDTYYYALTVNSAAGESPLGPQAVITVIDGQGAVVVGLPDLPAGGASFNVWREAMADAGWSKVGTAVTGASFTDTGFPRGSCLTDPSTQPPDMLAPSGTNSVTITVPDPEVVGAAPSAVKRWRLYRSDRSGSYGLTSLVAEVVETDLGEPLPTTYLDAGVTLLGGTPPFQSTTIRPSVAVAGTGGGGGGPYAPGAGPIFIDSAGGHWQQGIGTNGAPTYTLLAAAGGPVTGVGLNAGGAGFYTYWTPSGDTGISYYTVLIYKDGVATAFTGSAAANGTSVFIGHDQPDPGSYTSVVTTHYGATLVDSAPSAASVVSPPTVPDPPGTPVATPADSSASVAFDAEFAQNGGSPITGFRVTASPGGATATDTASPIVVSGLTNGTVYTFTVASINAIGTGAESVASDPVTVNPPTAPDAPTGVVATPGDGSASVAFTPGSNNGSAVTAYTVTASPDGATGTGSDTPIVVSGLTDGTAYTFTVVATNAIGDSPASAASAPVTPAAAVLSVLAEESAGSAGGWSVPDYAVNYTVGATGITVTALDILWTNPQPNCTMRIADAFTSGTQPAAKNCDDGTTPCSVVVVGDAGTGYRRVPLPAPITLPAGSDFSVVFHESDGTALGIAVAGLGTIGTLTNLVVDGDAAYGASLASSYAAYPTLRFMG